MATNAILNKVQKKKVNVKTKATSKANSGLSIPMLTTVFQSTTTLAVGEHKTVLQEVEEGISKNGSPKLTFVFKDIKGSGVALDTLSFGSLDTSRSQWDRLKYCLAKVKNHEIILNSKMNVGLKGDETADSSVAELIQNIDDTYNDILKRNSDEGIAYEISSDITEEEFDASAYEGADADEMREHEENHKIDFINLRKADLASKYAEARDNGFQIYTDKASKRSFAIVVEDNELDDLIPFCQILFNIVINKQFVIKLKQARNYINITSIHAK